MHLTVRKNITQKKQSVFKGPVNVLILLVAIPVILIAAVSLSIYFLFVWLKGTIFKYKQAEAADDIYHVEFDLLHNEHIRIILIEDEFDTELTELNELWQEKVYNEETCLYRAKSIPAIPALEGTIVCFYYKEQSSGVVLQLLSKTAEKEIVLNSRLVYLDYQTLQITPVDETGPFYLYNDKENPQLIQGFNKAEKLTIELISIGNHIM